MRIGEGEFSSLWRIEMRKLGITSFKGQGGGGGGRSWKTGGVMSPNFKLLDIDTRITTFSRSEFFSTKKPLFQPSFSNFCL